MQRTLPPLTRDARAWQVHAPQSRPRGPTNPFSKRQCVQMSHGRHVDAIAASPDGNTVAIAAGSALYTTGLAALEDATQFLDARNVLPGAQRPTDCALGALRP